MSGGGGVLYTSCLHHIAMAMGNELGRRTDTFCERRFPAGQEPLARSQVQKYLVGVGGPDRGAPGLSQPRSRRLPGDPSTSSMYVPPTHRVKAGPSPFLTAYVLRTRPSPARLATTSSGPLGRDPLAGVILVFSDGYSMLLLANNVWACNMSPSLLALCPLEQVQDPMRGDPDSSLV